MSFPDSCLAAAARLLDACRTRGIRLVTAESCTGGLVAGCLTEHAGASAVVDRGFIVYDNRAKIELLGVSPATLETFGAVSEACARELVKARSPAHLAGSRLPPPGSPVRAAARRKSRWASSTSQPVAATA